MLYSQYERIESIAGGVGASNRQFVRACHTRLNKLAKTRKMRSERHDWIRGGLAHFADAQTLYHDVMRGNF